MRMFTFGEWKLLKKIIDKATVPLVIEIPDEYIDRKVEVTVRPLDEKEEPKQQFDLS